jgi:hypothetical protein
LYYYIPYYTCLNHYFCIENLSVYINFDTIGFILALSLLANEKY